MIIGGTRETEKHIFLIPQAQTQNLKPYMTETIKIYTVIQGVF